MAFHSWLAFDSVRGLHRKHPGYADRVVRRFARLHFTCVCAANVNTEYIATFYKELRRCFRATNWHWRLGYCVCLPVGEECTARSVRSYVAYGLPVPGSIRNIVQIRSRFLDISGVESVCFHLYVYVFSHSTASTTTDDVLPHSFHLPFVFEDKPVQRVRTILRSACRRCIRVRFERVCYRHHGLAAGRYNIAVYMYCQNPKPKSLNQQIIYYTE